MNISEAGKDFGFSADTLRYYEKMGLIMPNRTKSGIRDYSENDLARLKFIRCMRDAGVSIEALKEYIDLFQEEEDTTYERRQILIDQREILLKKKESIEKTIELLNKKIQNYDSLCCEKKQVK
ncbi:MAG: MerR family transcriptional regulator [Bacilli bacterium]